MKSVWLWSTPSWWGLDRVPTKQVGKRTWPDEGHLHLHPPPPLSARPLRANTFSIDLRCNQRLVSGGGKNLKLKIILSPNGQLLRGKLLGQKVDPTAVLGGRGLNPSRTGGLLKTKIAILQCFSRVKRQQSHLLVQVGQFGRHNILPNAWPWSGILIEIRISSKTARNL